MKKYSVLFLVCTLGGDQYIPFTVSSGPVKITHAFTPPSQTHRNLALSFQRSDTKKRKIITFRNGSSYKRSDSITFSPPDNNCRIRLRLDTRRFLSKEKDGGDNLDPEEDKIADTESTGGKSAAKSKLMSLIPSKVLKRSAVRFRQISKTLPNVKLALASFCAGIVLTFVAVLVPIYDTVDKMTEPVTLFETILTDLDRGYVDDVDTKKLFETGISAMLRSLDPYTEFEGRTEAQELNESVSGKYGGVGLVISGALPQNSAGQQKEQPPSKDKESTMPIDANSVTNSETKDEIDGDDDSNIQGINEKEIRVVSAFEGYAFDYGMRTGDKIVAVDDFIIKPNMSVEDVRNKLRGEPGSQVSITIQRDGVPGENIITMPRAIVQLRDVKLASFIGKPEDGVGYIQLSGFAANAGKEVRNAILSLQAASEAASDGESSLQALILDLRGNPGGLLTSAVDVASLLVPKDSDIVSAKGRGFPGVLYRSRVEPILDPKTKLAVLVNGQTASAAEIVSGAIQDLDVGIIVGSDRTYGKGLVQNVEDLPFDTALKFTVAKYYTPSGRCIQSTNYKEGGGLNAGDGAFRAEKVEEKDKTTFLTKNGREVKDGGGVEADFKVETPQASALEVTLLRSGVLSDFASEWSKNHQLTNNFDVDDVLYRDFQNFVMQKQKNGNLKLESLYNAPIEQLKKALVQSGYKMSTNEVDVLRASIIREMQKDFEKYRDDIKEDISTNILARYLPESMLIQRSLKTDVQVNEAVKLLSNDKKFDKLLARTNPETHSREGRTMANGTGNKPTGNTNNASSDIMMSGRDESASVFKMQW